MPAHYDAAAMETRVEELKDEVTRRLAKSGQLDKMRAMYVDCALQLMAEEEGASAVPASEDALLFGRSHALTAELARDYAGRGGRHAALRIVGDYLRAHGLMHTLNVLCLETGLDEATLESGLDGVRAAVGAPPAAELPDPKAANSILQALVLGGAIAASTAVPAPTTHSVPATNVAAKHTPAAPASDAATSDHEYEQESAHSERFSSVPAPATAAPTAAAVTVYNSPLGPAPAFVSKGSESLYELEKCEGGEYIRFGQIAGQPFNGWRLKNCRILIFDAVDSVTMDECEDCELVVAAAQNSVFIRDCKRMTMTIACKQLRTRDCSDCVTYLFAGTDPVVESSHHMDFYPYNLASPNLPAQFAAAHLDANCNRFVHMYDFTADDATLPQPHFTVHWPIADPSDPMSRVVEYGAEFVTRPDNQGKGWQISTPAGVRGLLEGTVGPGSSSEKGTNKSYDIKTGANVWQQQQAAAAAAASAAATAPEPVAVTRPATAPVVPSASAVGSMVRKAHATSSDDDDSVGAGAGAMRRDTDDEKYDSFDSDSDHHHDGTEGSDDDEF